MGFETQIQYMTHRAKPPGTGKKGVPRQGAARLKIGPPPEEHDAKSAREASNPLVAHMCANRRAAQSYRGAAWKKIR